MNGSFIESASGKTFNTPNPATGETLAVVSEAGREDIHKAVVAARMAFDEGPWSRMSTAERSRLMYKLADLMEEHKEELAQLETLDNGKPIRETMAADIPLAIEHMRYYAGWATKSLVKQSLFPVISLTIHAMKLLVSLVKLSLGTSRFLWPCGKWEQRLLQDVQSF